MISNVTVAGQTVGVVSLAGLRAPRTVEFGFKDAVAVNTSPFTGQTQTYFWPGADMWCSATKPGTITLPQMTQNQADPWIAALMECRGMLNPFLLGDPLKVSPAGDVDGHSVPLIDNTTTGTNLAGQTQIYTKGWLPGQFRLLLPGDYLQIGYRLHRNLGVVNSDGAGKAVIEIWPSLREAPADGLAINLNNPQGLFRRASNEGNWSATIGAITSLSFQFVEWR